MVEMAAASPNVNDWSIVASIHHRSGVYGSFNNVEGGSNVVAIDLMLCYD